MTWLDKCPLWKAGFDPDFAALGENALTWEVSEIKASFLLPVADFILPGKKKQTKKNQQKTTKPTTKNKQKQQKTQTTDTRFVWFGYNLDLDLDQYVANHPFTGIGAMVGDAQSAGTIGYCLLPEPI